MPDLLLDVSRLLWRAWRGQFPTGIDRACLAYVRHYRHQALAVIQRGGFTCVLGKRDSLALFDILLGRPKDFRRAILTFSARACQPWRWAPRRSWRGALYLNVGHTGLNHAGHGRWVKKNGIRPAYYVHDLIPITHPQFVREGERERHIARMNSVIRHATIVMGNSLDSLRALHAHASGHGFSMPGSLCVPLGIETGFAETAFETPLASPYFVVLGTIEGRKNHQLLLRVWHRLAKDLGQDMPKLVIIGRRGWKADAIFQALDEDEDLKPHVIELSHCDDHMLKAWLSHARALLFPSFVEGQGLPLAEALVAGTPVIASDLAVFREMAGDIPEYVDVLDEDRWQEMIRAYCEVGSPSRAAQMERLKHFRCPTWEEHFRQVDRWIEENAA